MRGTLACAEDVLAAVRDVEELVLVLVLVIHRAHGAAAERVRDERGVRSTGGVVGLNPRASVATFDRFAC